MKRATMEKYNRSSRAFGSDKTILIDKTVNSFIGIGTTDGILCKTAIFWNPLKGLVLRDHT